MIRARHNPFASGRIQGLGFLLPQDQWHQLESRLRKRNYWGAIVGPCGSGKTTLLEALQCRLEANGLKTVRLFISREVRLPWMTIRTQVASLPTGGIIRLDGADHLSWSCRRQLKRLARKHKLGLIVTSHREGILPVLYRCRTDADLLETICSHLLDTESIGRRRLESLFRTHDGNLRECLRQLYDEYAGLAPGRY